MIYKGKRDGLVKKFVLKIGSLKKKWEKCVRAVSGPFALIIEKYFNEHNGYSNLE